MRTLSKMIMTTIAACLMVWCSVVVCAQDSQSVAQLKTRLKELRKHAYEKDAKVRTDSVKAEVLASGDKELERLLWAQYASIAFATRDVDAHGVAADHLRKLALERNDRSDYFVSYINEISNCINKKDNFRALELTKRMEKDANTLFGGAEGMAGVYKMYSLVYRNIGLTRKARDFARKAIAERRKANPSADLTDMYVVMASTQMTAHDFEALISVADEGLSQVTEKSPSNQRVDLLEMKCYALYQLDRIDEAEEQYANLAKEKIKGVTRVYSDILHYCHTKEFDKAQNAIDTRLNTSTVRDTWMARLDYERGSYQTAYENELKAEGVVIEANRKLREEEYDYYYSNYENSLLEEKNMLLDVQNSQLELQNANLALQRERENNEMQRVTAANTNLALNNENLKEARLAEEKARQEEEIANAKLLDEQNKKEAKERNIVMAFIIAAAILSVSVVLYQQGKNHIKLKHALATAEESERVKTRFLQNMSHEIRTPLNTIVGFSQILATQSDEFDDEQRREFCNIVDENTEMLTMLINDILDLSALENKEQQYKIRVGMCNAKNIAEGALMSVKPRCPEGVNLYHTSEIEGSCTFFSDSKRVKQVISNLLACSERHTTEGEIHLHSRVDRDADTVTFVVTDTGEGIPDAVAANMFKGEHLDVEEETSLNLRLSHQLAAKLGGELTLDRTYQGKGTRFVFTVPMTPKSEEASA